MSSPYYKTYLRSTENPASQWSVIPLGFVYCQETCFVAENAGLSYWPHSNLGAECAVRKRQDTDGNGNNSCHFRYIVGKVLSHHEYTTSRQKERLPPNSFIVDLRQQILIDNGLTTTKRKPIYWHWGSSFNLFWKPWFSPADENEVQVTWKSPCQNTGISCYSRGCSVGVTWPSIDWPLDITERSFDVRWWCGAHFCIILLYSLVKFT